MLGYWVLIFILAEKGNKPMQKFIKNIPAIYILLGLVFGISEIKAAPPKSSAKKEKKTTKVNPNNLIIKGKTFKLKTLYPVSLKADPSVNRPEPLSLTVQNRVKLPELNTGPSPLTPKIPLYSDLVKLSPLPQFNFKVDWLGIKEQRLSPTWTVPNVPAADPNVANADIVSDGEFKILESLLLLKSKETTPLSAGIAQPLLKNPETKEAAHEILGKGMNQLNIRVAGQEHFKELLKTDKNQTRAKRSLQSALNTFHTNDYDDAVFFAPHSIKLKLEDKDLKNLPLSLAKIAIEKKDLQNGWNAILRVPEDSKQAQDAQFLKALIYYRSNSVPEATKELESLLEKLKTQTFVNSKDLKSLTAATLGQIYFQQGQYKKAFDTYRLVDQEHPLWLETLVESAWSQILLKDYEGAAGNMFSLHTNYFQGAYKPESYIVRTVGYLQLCQFGDALSVLKSFLGKYKYTQKQLNNYKKQNPNHLEIVRDFLKAGTPKSFAGLPRSLLVEIARDPKFIENQKKLNEIEENAQAMAKLPSQLNDLDQKFHQAQIKYTQLLNELEGHIKQSNNPSKRESLLAEKRNFERHIRKNELLRKIVLEAKKGLIAEVESFTPIWNEKKTKIKSIQNVVLQNSYQNLEKDLEHWLDQSELLFYEIHNGAGEHLRYQMATHNNDKRAPASEKLKAIKKEDRDLLWSFDGEIWEDEIGHYRSSLKNVCPEESTQVKIGGSKSSTDSKPSVANSDESN